MDRTIKIIRALLIIFFIIWIIIWYSIRSFNNVNVEKSGLLNKFVVELYKTPSLIKTWFKEDAKFLQAIKLESKKDLFEIGMLEMAPNISDSIHLLFSKLKNESTTEVVLQNIKTGIIIKSWSISLDLIKNDLDSIRLVVENRALDGVIPKNYSEFIPSNPYSIGINSPVMLKDSSLVFHPLNFGHIYKIDKDSKLLWKSKRQTHHSIELDENENIWTCSLDFSSHNSRTIKYRDDAILCLNTYGEEIYFESLTKILKNNDLFKTLIESTPIADHGWIGLDPFHLNDVQPVLTNGLFWNKGDLFLSIRNKSMVILYRPRTGKVVWVRQGPWISQHDINIENDSIISIFNNNTSFFNQKVNNSSNIAYYNFRSDKVNFFANNIFISKTEGRQTRLTNRDLLIEATNEALFYLIDTSGVIKAKFYIPYQLDSSFAQYPNWAKVYERK